MSTKQVGFKLPFEISGNVPISPNNKSIPSQFPIITGGISNGQPRVIKGAGRPGSSGKTGPGPISSNSFLNTEMVRKTIGFMSNYSVHYHKLLRPFSDKKISSHEAHMMRLSKIYQIVFVFKKKNEDPKSTERAVLQRRYTEVDLVMLNFLLFKQDSDIKTQGGVMKTPYDVIRDWKFEGIVTSEEGKMLPYEYPGEITKEHLLNAVVRGRATCKNYWGNKIRNGTRLFLIIKRVRMSANTIFNLSPQNGPATLPIQEGYQIEERPIQVIPWANDDYEYPPDSELVYRIPHGKDEKNDEILRGFAIYVGRVENCIDGFNDKKINITTDIDSIVSQPNIMIHLDSMF